MYSLAIFLPLIGAIVVGFFGRSIGDKGSQWITSGLVILSAVISVIAFIDVAMMGNAVTVDLATWIKSGTFEARWALQFDTLTAVMMVVVTVVSACVHVYSIGYMHHDPAIPRFMAYLSLFTFSMLMLVTSNNLLQLFFGWEGVGVCSYLLIGFWYDRPSANAAAIKAFVVNRVGDFGFALGIVGCYLLFDSVSFEVIFREAPNMVEQGLTFLGMHLPALEIICFLLFIGAMGKSAQLGLHTWLPDAMEGPTPVSALIHAATMVTAGVFLVARMSPVFEYAPNTLAFITFIGASTAFFAATIGLTQTDIKRVIAYSTCSQLGYMFFACGVSAYPAAIFHLMTHAFFKALLFLGAGSVIHAMSDEQDMRRMGGIWRHIKKTYILMWIGSLALAGLPFFAGYFSKDIILESAFASGSTIGGLAFVLGILAACMTAFYSWRLLFMTFHGEPKADEKVMAHVHESPPIMLVPLYVLAAGALFAGLLFAGMMVGDDYHDFWGHSIFILESNTALHDAHYVPLWVKLLPIVVSLFGIWLAYILYIRHREALAEFVASTKGVYLFLLNKWYFDELYDAVFVRPARWFGRLFWKGGDGRIIDGFGPNGIAARVVEAARGASRLQSGYVYHYAFAMLIGVVLLLTWYFSQSGA
jgi:NADH-quinone oxidoreductase subunit L